jgi:hypothetical protein
VTQLPGMIKTSLRKMVIARRKTASAPLFIFAVASMLTVFGFRSAPGCELPGRIISSTFDPNKRMHEFRVPLKSPDFTNVSVLKQHLTFATVLTRILIAEVSSRSRSKCSIIASTSLFPGLRVSVHYSLLDESDKCSGLVTDILTDFVPSQESVEKIVSSIASAKKFSATHTAGYMMEANNVLNDVLRYIYEKDSAMHALVSVGPVDFESTSPSSFLTWLEIQRSSNRMMLTPLVMCRSEDEILNTGPSNGNMPYSSIIAPQALSLALPENQSPPPRLHYVVVVGGDFQPEYAVHRSVATEKYCRHENTYSLGAANSPFVARTRCLTEVFHNTDTWVALFCDPRDCSSEELAEKVATTIVNDPDVVALGRVFARYAQARGPYLVKLRNK